MSRGSLRVSRRLGVLWCFVYFFSWLGTWFLFCYDIIHIYICCPQFTGVCNIDIDIASLEMLFFVDILLLKEMWWAVQIVSSECVLWHVQQQMLSTFLGQSLTNNNFYKHQHNTPFWQSNSWGETHRVYFFRFLKMWHFDCRFSKWHCMLIDFVTYFDFNSLVWNASVCMMVEPFEHMSSPRKKNYDKKSISLIFRPTYYLEQQKITSCILVLDEISLKKMTCDWVRLYDKTPKRT